MLASPPCASGGGGGLGEAILARGETDEQGWKNGGKEQDERGATWSARLDLRSQPGVDRAAEPPADFWTWSRLELSDPAGSTFPAFTRSAHATRLLPNAIPGLHIDERRRQDEVRRPDPGHR